MHQSLIVPRMWDVPSTTSSWRYSFSLLYPLNCRARVWHTRYGGLLNLLNTYNTQLIV